MCICVHGGGGGGGGRELNPWPKSNHTHTHSCALRAWEGLNPWPQVQPQLREKVEKLPCAVGCTSRWQHRSPSLMVAAEVSFG